MSDFVPVYAYLSQLALSEPMRAALHIPVGGVKLTGPTRYHSPTFAELNALVNKFAAGLQQLGLKQGDRVALMVPPCEEFFALTFALLRTGIVPVLIDPGMGLKNLGQCLAEAHVTAFIGVPKALFARRLFGWAKGAKLTVSVGRKFFSTTSTNAWRKLSIVPTLPTLTASDPAAILFTSGSTGIAKGVPYTQGIFAEQVKLLKVMYGIEPGEVDWCSFPLFALFGPALGMTCVIPDLNASKPATMNPDKARQQLKQFKVTNVFASPAVVRRLSQERDPSAFTTVRRVISAGAPARTDVLVAMQEQLPTGVQIFTPYGATESLPVANIGSREILSETATLTAQGRGVCLGLPVPGVTVRVIRIDDNVIETWSDDLLVPQGEIGEFVVQSTVTTREYFARPAATAYAKIRGPHDEVLHRMGDVGYVDEHGRLWFCGRKSHRVVTPERTYFTDGVEPIFNTIEGIERTALVGVTLPTGNVPVLCVEMLPKERFSDVLPRLMMHGAPLGITRFLQHPKFPVDVRHNSKIFREQLAVWAATKVKL